MQATEFFLKKLPVNLQNTTFIEDPYDYLTPLLKVWWQYATLFVYFFYIL
jgi:hypothetical protein